MRKLILLSLFCISPYMHAEDEAMNILYAADEGYAIPTCVSIASILANCPSENKLNIIVVDTGMSEKSRKAIENLKKIRDFKLEFRKFDMERLKIFDVGEWSPSVRIKLYINEFFPNAEKAMWVNGNIIFRKNIKRLYDVDLTGKYFAAVNCLEKSMAIKTGKYGITDCCVLYNFKLMNLDGFSRVLEWILRNQSHHKAYTGEFALVSAIDFKDKYIYDFKDCACSELSDCAGKCVYNNGITLLKFSARHGYGPWENPRFLYPSIAIETYDEWHKYCDMTDYKGLKERLSRDYTFQDICNYYKRRINRFCKLYKERAIQLLVKTIRFINGAPKNA